MDQSNSSHTPSRLSSRGDRRKFSSRISPFWIRLAYPLFRYFVLPFYFSEIWVSGREHLPQEGAVILAPTHRSRWDALIVGYVAGRYVTGRDLHFMVSVDEMRGLQGWFVRRLGGFPVNPGQPSFASLRHSINLLRQKRMLVIFPEGQIVRSDRIPPIELGLSYLALQAETTQPTLGIQVVPLSIRYHPPVPRWRSKAEIQIGPPLSVTDYCQKPRKDCAQQLRDDLQAALEAIR